MKKVLVTGANSYVGTNVEKWLMKEPDKYYIETLDMKDPNWKDFDFSKFDVVFHVAGIAHVSAKKSMKKLYYKINKDLAIQTAEKAKNEGVSQFIFMSSIIVYSGCKRSCSSIDLSTKPQSNNFYGDSKLQAEIALNTFKDSNFKVLILRPPMIYGSGSRGNFPKLSKISLILPIFPNFPNKRSILHIDNLCQFIKLMIDYEKEGIFFPQNKEFVSTTQIVKTVNEVHKRKILLTKMFNPLIRILVSLGLLNKIFGDLTYQHSMSSYDNLDYQIRSFKETIILTERNL